MPVRIQLSRRKGFDLQAASRAANGLQAKVVARPSRYGNPFRVVKVSGGNAWQVLDRHGKPRAFAMARQDAAAEAVRLYRAELLASGVRRKAARELCGYNAACWCALCPEHAAGKPLGVKCDACAPCHADVLLDIANQEPKP